MNREYFTKPTSRVVFQLVYLVLFCFGDDVMLGINHAWLNPSLHVIIRYKYNGLHARYS